MKKQPKVKPKNTMKEPVLTIDGINIINAGIVKRGVFENGSPIGWGFDSRNGDPILSITEDKKILIGGLYSETLTKEYRQSLGSEEEKPKPIGGGGGSPLPPRPTPTFPDPDEEAG